MLGLVFYIVQHHPQKLDEPSRLRFKICRTQPKFYTPKQTQKTLSGSLSLVLSDSLGLYVALSGAYIALLLRCNAF